MGSPVKGARVVLLTAALVGGLLLGLGGESAPARTQAPARSQATGPVLGVLGNIARFKQQTGQETLVQHAFLGWGQGQTFAAHARDAVPGLRPDPDDPSRDEAARIASRSITPGEHRAPGKGDSYLIALNQGDRGLGQGDLRAADGRDEQLGTTLYSGFIANGQPRGRRPHAGQLTGRRSRAST